MSPPRLRVRTLGLLTLIIWSSTFGCTAPGEQTTIAAATDSGSSASLAAGDSTDAERPAIRSDDPFLVYGFPEHTDAPATISQIPVRLVNGSDETLIVSATGGEAEVVLDTVPAADSALVRIETPAESLTVTARTRSGDPVAVRTVVVDTAGARVAFPR